MSFIITKETLQKAPWYKEFYKWMKTEMKLLNNNGIELCINESCAVASFMIPAVNSISISPVGILIGNRNLFPLRHEYTLLGFLGTILAVLRAKNIEDEKYWTGIQDKYNGLMDYARIYYPILSSFTSEHSNVNMDRLLFILSLKREDIDFIMECNNSFTTNEALSTELESAKRKIKELELNIQIQNVKMEQVCIEESLETKFSATPMQTILLFRELGMDFTNGSVFNKTKVKKMLNILTTKSEGNINKKLTAIDDDNKYVKNDLKIVKDLLEDIKN